MADKKIKISELPESSSTGGLFTLGVNSQNGSVKVPLGSIVDGISQQAYHAVELSQQANNTAGNAVGIANEASTNAASAKTKAEAALAAANNAETRNDIQDAAIGTLQTDVEALKEGGAGVTDKWVVDLGESDNGAASDMWNKAPSRAAEPAIAGNKEIRRILFTVTDGVKTYGAFIDQNVYDASCVQMMYLNGRRFDRFINFTDNSRTEVASGGIQTWQRTDVRNVAYNQGERKVWLQNMWGQGVGGDAQLPLSTDTVDGLMPKGTLTSIAQLRSDVAALQAGGSGGGTDYSGEIASLQQKDADQDAAISSLQSKDTTHDTDIEKLQNDLETLRGTVEAGGVGTDYSGEIAALNTAVEGHTSAISSIQQKDTEQDDAISSLQSKEATQDSDIEALSAKSEELEAGITSMQADVSEHGSDIGQMKQDIASLKTATEPQTVDASALDSLCPSVEAAKSLIQHAEKMRYIVTVTKGGISICVGELIMYADSGALQVTQELRSHYLITGNNVSSNSVRLDAANTYCRSFGVLSNDHSATGGWTEWKPKGGVLDIGISDINSNSAIRMNVPTLLQDASVCGNLYVSRVLFTIKLDSNGNTYSGTADQIVSGSQCVQRMQLNGRIFTRSINFSDAARGTVSFVQPWQDSEARNLSYNKNTGAIGMANMWGDAVGVSANIPVSDDTYMGLVPAGTLTTMDYRKADVMAILQALVGGVSGKFAGFAPDDCTVMDSPITIDPTKMGEMLYWRKPESTADSGWVIKSGDSYFNRWEPVSSYNEAQNYVLVSDGTNQYVKHNNTLFKLDDSLSQLHSDFSFFFSNILSMLFIYPSLSEDFSLLNNQPSEATKGKISMLKTYSGFDYETGNIKRSVLSFFTHNGQYAYQYLFVNGEIRIRTIEYTDETRTTVNTMSQWRTL